MPPNKEEAIQTAATAVAATTSAANPSPFVRNYTSWASYLPGISIIRNHVINPLLVATERVVESYIPDNETPGRIAKPVAEPQNDQLIADPTPATGSSP